MKRKKSFSMLLWRASTRRIKGWSFVYPFRYKWKVLSLLFIGMLIIGIFSPFLAIISLGTGALSYSLFWVAVINGQAFYFSEQDLNIRNRWILSSTRTALTENLLDQALTCPPLEKLRWKYRKYIKHPIEHFRNRKRYARFSKVIDISLLSIDGFLECDCKIACDIAKRQISENLIQEALETISLHHFFDPWCKQMAEVGNGLLENGTVTHDTLMKCLRHPWRGIPTHKCLYIYYHQKRALAGQRELHSNCVRRIRKNPDDAWAWYVLGTVLMLSNGTDQIGVLCLDKAVELDSELNDYRKRTIKGYRYMKRLLKFGQSKLKHKKFDYIVSVPREKIETRNRIWEELFSTAAQHGLWP